MQGYWPACTFLVPQWKVPVHSPQGTDRAVGWPDAIWYTLKRTKGAHTASEAGTDMPHKVTGLARAVRTLPLGEEAHQAQGPFLGSLQGT